MIKYKVGGEKKMKNSYTQITIPKNNYLLQYKILCFAFKLQKNLI